ncbi:MAG TPA: cytochrome c oxidase subunit II [Candidatus Acidoferrales bacterium]|nr:cytochrome c oxidase subunit II [Candidatus Acidoferrales bacterium]
MRGTPPLRLWLAALGWGVLTSACEAPGGVSPIFPEPVSANGQNIYNLYVWISIPAIAVFLLIQVLLLIAILRFRRKTQPPGYQPPQVHGHTLLEIGWTIGPFLIVAAIGVASFVELQQDFTPRANADFEVTITGRQFGWDYQYPEGFTVHQEGSLTSDVEPFVVPVGRLIRLRFQGQDVVHSWWVPAISGKTDAVPGYDNFSWMNIEPRFAGQKFRGECAELCGVLHYSMQIIVQAMTQPDFDAWVKQQQQAAKPSPSPTRVTVGSSHPVPSPRPTASPTK